MATLIFIISFYLAINCDCSSRKLNQVSGDGTIQYQCSLQDVFPGQNFQTTNTNGQCVLSIDNAANTISRQWLPASALNSPSEYIITLGFIVKIAGVPVEGSKFTTATGLTFGQTSMNSDYYSVQLNPITNEVIVSEHSASTTVLASNILNQNIPFNTVITLSVRVGDGGSATEKGIDYKVEWGSTVSSFRVEISGVNAGYFKAGFGVSIDGDISADFISLTYEEP